jgi:amylosucrase
VFPDVAPGSFTHVPEMGGWVWTTFNRYQWDLDFRNPEVFAAVLATALRLANHGVDVLRLDAVPFLWHRVGTDCRNLPEVHLILQALRALVRVAAPGVLLKAEAIVAPEHVVQYLGAHDQQRRECDLAYHNQLMVMLWSSVATRDATLARVALSRMRPEPPGTSWATFLRNHDDIGWAVSDADAAAVGWDGPSHRRFLNDYFAGRYEGSFARGALFGADPRSGDARICGTSAALCGIEAARRCGDADALALAVRRLETLYAVVFSFGGIPLLWMGDELALGDDELWTHEPGHAEDGRWRHRPRMPWAVAGRRHDPDTVEGSVFDRIQRLATARRAQPALRAGGETTVLHPDDPAVLAYRRRHPTSGPLLVLASFADESRSVSADLLRDAGIGTACHVHSTEGRLAVADGRLRLPPWGFAWIGGR